MRCEPRVRSMFKDARGGRRRRHSRIVTPALFLVLISLVVPGCTLDPPTAPNTPGELTGQTSPQEFDFSGSVSLSSFPTTVPADDLRSITIRAEVKDTAGNPVQNFVQVTFRTDLGGFQDVGIDAQGNPVAIVVPSTVRPTFNGVAEVEFQSVDRGVGTANIIANVADATASLQVVVEPAAIRGSLSMGFTTGAGPITATGSASQNSPLDVVVGVLALDIGGDPIPGAEVRFNIVQDTTDEGSPNDAAHWLAPSTTNTGSLGDAANVIRVYGSGTIVMSADLVDPISGEIIARSNRIILTTSAALIVKLEFSSGGDTLLRNAPFNVGLVSRVFDGTNAAQPGLQVRFEITGDTTTGGATLSSTIATTDATGTATSSVRVPDPGTVTIRAALYDAQNNIIASATVTATGT